MFGKLINPFGVTEDYRPPEWYKPTHIHDMNCTCQSKRCFGYVSERWQRLFDKEQA